MMAARGDRARGKHPQHVVVTRDLAKLKRLTDYLNALGHERPRRRPKLQRAMLGPTRAEVLWEVRELLELAQQQLEETDRRSVLARFNALARETPMVWKAAVGPDGWPKLTFVPTQNAEEGAGPVYLLAYALLEADTKARTRFKRCSACARWFVDITLGNRKLSCSQRCAWRLKKRQQRQRQRSPQQLPRPPGVTGFRAARP